MPSDLKPLLYTCIPLNTKHNRNVLTMQNNKKLFLVIKTSAICLSVFPPFFISFLLTISPSGKKFRSKPQLARYLGNTVDLGCFDFRTGKMMPGKLQKNKQRLRHDPLSLAKVALKDFSLWGRAVAALWLCRVSQINRLTL